MFIGLNLMILSEFLVRVNKCFAFRKKIFKEDLLLGFFNY